MAEQEWTQAGGQSAERNILADEPSRAGAKGKITQVIGAVVDVEFPPDAIPAMYNALKVTVQATMYASSSGYETDVLDIYHTANINTPSWQFVATLSANPRMPGEHHLSTTFTLPLGDHQAIRGTVRRGGTAQPCSLGSYDDHDDLVFAVAPSTDPVVSFTSPTSGSLNRGTLTVSANATDNVGITRVEFFQGSTLLATSTSAPYGFSWNAPNGPITLTARAYDGEGNTGTASVSFTVDNQAPTVAITSPAEGGTVSGTV